MLKKKIEILNKISDSDDFIKIDFNDLLNMEGFSEIVEDLIFLVGYNYIVVEKDASNSSCFFAGMFPGDMDEKITIIDHKIDGKLLLAIETVFNVLQDLKSQSNILELYPRDVRESIVEGVLNKNKIEQIFLNQISYRMNL